MLLYRSNNSARSSGVLFTANTTSWTARRLSCSLFPSHTGRTSMPITFRPTFSLSTSIKHTGVYTAFGLVSNSSASIAPMRPAPIIATRILFFSGNTFDSASRTKEIPVARYTVASIQRATMDCALRNRLRRGLDELISNSHVYRKRITSPPSRLSMTSADIRSKEGF